ncbi:MAG: [FeFe] hydrogenase H-cluster maturation GTPase HydF [Bacteroidales bacterium]|nr:[FeFe] hydrogenase H-cluster maturation GTPase HydF [Bacteroidales bacterium]
MENTTKENRKYIGFFGRTNVGKSTLVNALTGQEISIVSQERGTTTDVVKKNMELFGYGAVVIVDTAGLDDDTSLGQKRIKASLHALTQMDLAVLVVSENRFDELEESFIEKCKKYDIPFVILYNKADICPINEELKEKISLELNNHSSESMLKVSELLSKTLKAKEGEKRTPLQNIVKKGDVILLVTPIDSAAPAGRLILPQVQLIRDVLDKDCICIAVKETDLEMTLKEKGIKPDLVITDSKVFEMVDKIVPKDIKLTSFSVVLARMKGAFEQYLKGTPYLDKLKDGDKVLMLESCTHQPTCEDIGRVKLPQWISKYTGKKLEFSAVSGLSEIETPLTDFAMIIQCGGCVATATQIRNRLLPALENNVPVSNYGLVIAYIHGIFNRATEIFK